MVAPFVKKALGSTVRPEPKSPRKSALHRSRLAGGLGAFKTLQLEPEKWEHLGKNLGIVLSQEDKDRISLIINEYLYWESTERSAPACVDEFREIERVRSEAVRLREALYRHESLAATNALIKISVSFQKRSKSDTKSYEIFRRSILKLIASCDDEIRNIEAENGWEIGASWALMVNKITKYFKKQKYKTGARQDGLSSPFVSFLWGLHQYLLDDFGDHPYIRGLASEAALAKAIHRARSSKNSSN